MSNTLLTPSIIAREALMVLENNLVMAGLVHRDYSNEFQQVGSTISIRKPATFVANEFTSTTSAQNAVEESVSVTLDKHLDVTFALGPKELTLDIQDFSAQFIVPAMAAIGQKVDSLLTGLYAQVPYYYGTAGTAPNTLAAIAGARKVLNVNKAPMMDRALVLDPDAEAAILVLDGIVNADKAGWTDGLREASIGRVFGFNTFMDQNIAAHTAGAGTVKIDLSAGYDAGVKAIHVDGVTTALKVGDLVVIGDAQYTIAAAGSLATNDQDITLDRGLEAAVANDADVTLVASHTANLAFHKNAFALVTRPLAAPLGAAKSEVMNYNGLAVRVVYDYTSSSKTDTVSIDLLCGVKCIDPRLACRLLG